MTNTTKICTFIANKKEKKLKTREAPIHPPWRLTTLRLLSEMTKESPRLSKKSTDTLLLLLLHLLLLLLSSLSLSLFPSLLLPSSPSPILLVEPLVPSRSRYVLLALVPSVINFFAGCVKIWFLLFRIPNFRFLQSESAESLNFV